MSLRLLSRGLMILTSNSISRRSSGVERFLGKEEVTSSNLVIGSNVKLKSSYTSILATSIAYTHNRDDCVLLN